MDAADLLRAGAATLGLALDDVQIGQFLALRDLLLEWNVRVNLTAITEPRAVLVRHFLDALACMVGCDGAERAASLHVLDVGSGAGLPGLALAIALPHWHVTSLEATGKKVRFQEAAIAALNLTNARAVQGRAETVARETGWRGAFAVVTARALAALPTLLEWCQPFAQVGGCVLAPKKSDLGDEMTQGARAAHTLGGDPPESLPLPPDLLTLAPDLADERAIIRVRQRHLSAPRYPRPGAASMKTPLGIAPTKDP